MPNELENRPKIQHSTGLGTSNMSLKVGEKGVALKVDEKAVSHLNPALHAPARNIF